MLKYGLKTRTHCSEIAKFGQDRVYWDETFNFWSGRQDSNLRPPRPKRGALPTALRPGQKIKVPTRIRLSTVATPVLPLPGRPSVI